MKRLPLLFLPLALFVAGAIAVITTRDEPAPNRSALEVASAFAYHLDKGNFGKACGLYDQDIRGPSVESCSQGFIFNSGQNMAFFGIDIFDEAKIAPNSEKVVSETKVTYYIVTKELPPARLVVEKQKSGLWKVTKVG